MAAVTESEESQPQDSGRRKWSGEPAKAVKHKKPKKPKKPKNTTGEMTIAEHINELRRRLAVGVIAALIGTIFGYVWYAHALGPIPSLGELLRQPYCSLPSELRFGASDGECRLLATRPFEMFLLRLKVGSLAGVVLTSPIWLGQLWAYITPGLKKNEKRWTAAVSLVAGALFIAGAVIAYFVLSYGLEFLLGIGQEAQVAALTGDEYFSFVLGLIVIFGVSFEVPLITVLLNAFGVISYKQLAKRRRLIWAFLFVFAAFATPGQDPYSMVILAIALCLLMEFATQCARLNDRRRAKKISTEQDLIDAGPTPIDRAEPINPSSVAGDASLAAPQAEPVTPIAPTRPVTAQQPRRVQSARPSQTPGAPEPGTPARPTYSPETSFDDTL